MYSYGLVHYDGFHSPFRRGNHFNIKYLSSTQSQHHLIVTGILIHLRLKILGIKTNETVLMLGIWYVEMRPWSQGQPIIRHIGEETIGSKRLQTISCYLYGSSLLVSDNEIWRLLSIISSPKVCRVVLLVHYQVRPQVEATNTPDNQIKGRESSRIICFSWVLSCHLVVFVTW